MASELDRQTGTLTSGKPAGVKKGKAVNTYHDYGEIPVIGYGDTGGASRFFYCAKANTAERGGATHPTVKPIKLVIYLVNMFCRKGGTVLDPHNGQGTTCEACLESGMNYIGIDNDPTSHVEAEARINRWKRNYNSDLL